TGPLHLESTERLRQRLDAGERLFGPDLGAWVRGFTGHAAGPGSVAPDSIGLADRIQSLEAFPKAGDVALLGATGAPVPPETLAPVYLREAAFVKAPPHRRIPGITD
ncbi:MAG: hypothetical protein ACKOKG_14950, partial [Verrucomicrobiota bacterium]